MGSVSSAGLSFLTQSGGLLSDLPAPLSATALQSAPEHDVVALSSAALQLQQVDGILGLTPPSSSAITPETFTPQAVSDATSTSPVSLSLPSGVSSADLTNATPQQESTIANATNEQQLVQSLFYPAASSSPSISTTG